MAINVFLVDDHQVVREGLKRMLELDAEIKVIGEAASAEEAINQAQHLAPDVTLLDVRMPGMGGIEAIKQLKEVHPAAKIIILTLYQDQYLSSAIESGAVGYLVKDNVTPEELAQAIRAVHHGDLALSPSITKSVLAEYLSSIKVKQSSDLTQRQIEILRLIADGATNSEIEQKLFLSQATVKRDIHAIFDTLDVHDRTQAVSVAYKKNLI